jgi:outer membrane protein OmpA-like peptidoglycan-associated protein
VVGRERPAAPEHHRSAWLWVLPILAGLIAIGWYWSSRRSAPNSSPNAAAPTMPARPQAQAPQPGPSITPVTNYLASGNQVAQRFTFRELTFATGSSQLSNPGQQIVRQLSGALKTHPTATVRLEGYNDAAATGTANTNSDLSLRRADAVKQALMQDGIAGNRIETAGNPAGVPNENAPARVDVIVRGGAQQ